jgi:hypothetical protein
LKTNKPYKEWLELTEEGARQNICLVAGHQARWVMRNMPNNNRKQERSKPLLGVKKPANRPRLVPEKGSPKRTHKEQGNLEDKTSVIHSVQQRKKDITGKTRRLELKKVHLFFLSMVAASTACIP